MAFPEREEANPSPHALQSLFYLKTTENPTAFPRWYWNRSLAAANTNSFSICAPTCYKQPKDSSCSETSTSHLSAAGFHFIFSLLGFFHSSQMMIPVYFTLGPLNKLSNTNLSWEFSKFPPSTQKQAGSKRLSDFRQVPAKSVAKPGREGSCPQPALELQSQGENNAQRQRSSCSGALWTLSTSLSLLEAPCAELGSPTSWASPQRSQTPQVHAWGTPTDLPKSHVAGDTQREGEQGTPEPTAGAPGSRRANVPHQRSSQRGHVLACSCCKAFTKAFFSRLVCSAFSAFF